MSDSASGVHVLLINEMSDRQKWAKEGGKKKDFRKKKMDSDEKAHHFVVAVAIQKQFVLHTTGQ